MGLSFVNLPKMGQRIADEWCNEHEVKQNVQHVEHPGAVPENKEENKIKFDHDLLTSPLMAIPIPTYKNC